MPIGCRWTYKYWDGILWQERFTGKENGYFVTELYDLSQQKETLLITKKYNLNGLLVSRKWRNGSTETYEPNNCNGVLDECSYLTKKSNGESFEVHTFSFLEGNNIRMRITEQGERRDDIILEVGPFNVAVSLTDVGSPVQYEVTLFSDCHLLS